MRLTVILAVVFFMLLAALQSFSQVTRYDQSEILAILTGLSANSINPSDALDPSLSEEEREKALMFFPSSDYQLDLRPSGDVVSRGPDSASLPVRVRFKTPNRELNAGSTVLFVKRSGKWYLANFDFLSMPSLLIGVIAVSTIIGIGYAAVVLSLLRKLVRSGKFDIASGAKIFVPIYWPSLFRAP